MEKIDRYLKLNLPEPYSTFLWGARKVGKSTYLKQKFPNSLYIDLLKTDVLQRYINHPHYLREEILAAPEEVVNHPIILDEVQKVPQLLDEVHWMMENIEGIQFILCGSSVRKLKQSGSNLLGGRAWRAMFMPLCFPEIKALDWDKIMNRGLLPSHYLSPYAHKLLSSYVMDYLLPEVHLEANLRSSQGFTRFLDALGFCQGELLNYSNIARYCGVDAKTVKTYFEILSDMYIGYFLQPFTKRASRQVIRETPKFYLLDTGLAHYLKKYTFTGFKGSDAGKAFEHYIFLELMAHKLLNDLNHTINFWRTQGGLHEVDFVLENGQIAIEAKISTPITKADLKGLLLFGKEHNAKLHVVTLEPRKRLMKVDDQEVFIWPIEEFLSALWSGDFLRKG
jgi:predicted AAA+ superfamily ATPase